jgi:hypothetical protein
MGERRSAVPVLPAAPLPAMPARTGWSGSWPSGVILSTMLGSFRAMFCAACSGVTPVWSAILGQACPPARNQGPESPPVGIVESVDETVHLRCGVRTSRSWNTPRRPGSWKAPAATGPTSSPRWIPAGEVDIHRGEPVFAIDGPIGHVQGLVVDPADQHVTHVLLDEGHLWGKKRVAIPIRSVTDVKAGVRLDLAKHGVRDLPPVDLDDGD